MTRHKHAAPSLPPHLRNRSCRCLELLKWGWHAVSLGGSSQSLPNVEIDNEGRVEVYFSGQILHCDSIPKSAKALARITKLLRHMDLGRRLHAWEHGAGHRDTPGIMTHIYIYIYIEYRDDPFTEVPAPSPRRTRSAAVAGVQFVLCVASRALAWVQGIHDHTSGREGMEWTDKMGGVERYRRPSRCVYARCL